ncbi:uncharacterized protein LOC117112495 [Anneissia japonica]|uniref:uncharacterized protein LOC117112495 n=1 Tax=Anneissia japonica TaxID=1529436 RepID=UPI0014257843|nr:uncharacterized protein LOC117112495 [Anneissia japonica]
MRWRIVIHGSIEGYSTMLVFLSASDNNTKEVVARHFLAATSVYGIPSRIRVGLNHDGENNDILCNIMNVIRGPDRRSAIRGRSVHNQRIERSWVDLRNGVTNVYYDLFHFLEDQRLLDIDKEHELWALHYIYIPRVNRDIITLFRNQWNNHGLRTEHQLSLIQLFVQRSLQLFSTNLTAVQELFEVQNNEEVMNSGWNEDEDVNVPAVTCPLSSDALENLKREIDPLDDSRGEFGIELFRSVVEFIMTILANSISMFYYQINQNCIHEMHDF